MIFKTNKFTVEFKVPDYYKSQSYRPTYKEDCINIVNVCKSHGLILTKGEADYLWSEISDREYAAGWMNPEHMNIWEEVSGYMKKELDKVFYFDELEGELEEDYEC